MADVAITKSKSITIRGGQIPSSPVIPETPDNPVTIPPTPPHNNLSGLQGGTSGEYYHLTDNEYDAVLGANSPDGTNPFATMADLSGGGSDTNKVSYNVADSKTASEQQQARDNIGSTSATPQIVATAGVINDLSITSNHIVFTGASVVLTGIVAGFDGQEVTLLNASGTVMTITVESLSSTASNRIFGIINLTIPNLSSIRIKYRTTNNRWVLETVGVLDNRYLVKNSQTLNTSTNIFFDTTASNDGDIAFRIRNLAGLVLKEIRESGNTILNGLTYRWQFTNAQSGRTWGAWNSGGNEIFSVRANNTIFARYRSTAFDGVIRRDELPFNYPQTVATVGNINNLSLTDEGIKLLILTAATDLTGVVPVSTTTGRLLRIESRVGGGVIIRHESASSTAANRFTLPGAVDLTIANGEVYTFIYTNGRWRRAL